MAPPKVSIQDLVKECGIQEAWLKREVDREHYYEISSYLSQWRRLATKFDISQSTVEDIESDNTKAEKQKVSFLGTWKHESYLQGTNRSLTEHREDRRCKGCV